MIHAHLASFAPAVLLANRARAFTHWLEVKFHLSNFESVIITRKAEETFRDPRKQPIAPLADQLLEKAEEGKKRKL